VRFVRIIRFFRIHENQTQGTKPRAFSNRARGRAGAHQRAALALLASRQASCLPVCLARSGAPKIRRLLRNAKGFSLLAEQHSRRVGKLEVTAERVLAKLAFDPGFLRDFRFFRTRRASRVGAPHPSEPIREGHDMGVKSLDHRTARPLWREILVSPESEKS
jgi:hypothetical protein